MNYALEIRKNNVACHLDLEKEITTKRDGLLTFTVRINSGNIVDFNCTDYIDVRTYLGLKTVTYEELAITLDFRAGSEINPVRDNHNDSPA